MKDQKEIQKLVDDYAQALKDLENTTDMEKKAAAWQRAKEADIKLAKVYGYVTVMSIGGAVYAFPCETMVVGTP